MNARGPFGLPIRQIAYFTPDIRAAAIAHAAHFGSGPYFIAENVPLSLCRHRGAPAQLDHSSAYGQWGEVMIEFVQQNNKGASVFRDLYPEGRAGLHHVALFVDDLDAAIAAHERAGFQEALYAEIGGGAVRFAMMDATAQFGHFIELYEPSAPILALYARVRDAARASDDGPVLRTV